MPVSVHENPIWAGIAHLRWQARAAPIDGYRGRNVVERCFNKLKQWRGIAMRSDKTARSYRAAISLAATLIWIKTDVINTA
jgi:transposase